LLKLRFEPKHGGGGLREKTKPIREKAKKQRFLRNGLAYTPDYASKPSSSAVGFWKNEPNLRLAALVKKRTQYSI